MYTVPGDTPAVQTTAALLHCYTPAHTTPHPTILGHTHSLSVSLTHLSHTTHTQQLAHFDHELSYLIAIAIVVNARPC